MAPAAVLPTDCSIASRIRMAGSTSIARAIEGTRSIGILVEPFLIIDIIFPLARALNGDLRIVTAADLLGLGQRQVQRLIRKVEAEGAMAVRPRLRGRPSNNRISNLKRDCILSLICSDHPDFGPTLAAEKLAERHDIRVSSETLRQWMIVAGLWHNRARRRQVHQPRLRREALGELIHRRLRASLVRGSRAGLHAFWSSSTMPLAV